MSRLGGSDCERAGDGVLAQPINALSSLVYVPAGALVLIPARRASRRKRAGISGFAGALAGVGVGSFAYHGPQPAWARGAHDCSLIIAAACALLIGAHGARDVQRIWRRGAGKLGATLAAAALAAYAGGHTQSPLCRPDSRLQLHGAWHVLTAGAAVAFAWAAVGESSAATAPHPVNKVEPLY
jgi:hypothetical protein